MFVFFIELVDQSHPSFVFCYVFLPVVSRHQLYQHPKETITVNRLTTSTLYLWLVDFLHHQPLTSQCNDPITRPVPLPAFRYGAISSAADSAILKEGVMLGIESRRSKH